MGWAGTAALIAWHDVECGREAEYVDWHSREHLKERLAVPGFVQGRRYSAAGPGSQYLILYTVDDPSVFASLEYQERLNHPSERTREVMPALRNMNWSLCRVEASSGFGAGRWLQTARFSPDPECVAGLRSALTGEVQVLATRSGLCAAHLLIVDRDRSRAPTREAELRMGRDSVADWVLLVEGHDEAAVAQDRSALLRPDGAASEVSAELYALDHICWKDDSSSRGSTTG